MFYVLHNLDLFGYFYYNITAYFIIYGLINILRHNFSQNLLDILSSMVKSSINHVSKDYEEGRYNDIINMASDLELTV